MSLDFDDLRRALDLWADGGETASFWWRDDDAARPTPALTRLLDLAADAGVEIAVAVVPALAAEELPGFLAACPGAVVVQHGYRHRNHAAPGEPAIECGGKRPAAEALQELRAGRARMHSLFGDRFRPVLAAPWNRIARPVLEGLRASGFAGASAAGSRSAMAGAGIAVANAHVDPINWRERRFAGTGKALSGIIGELEARRTGASERDEPLGLLTHHLDHDDALWDFLQQLFDVTRAHPAARWLTIDAAFAAPQERAARPPGRP